MARFLSRKTWPLFGAIGLLLLAAARSGAQAPAAAVPPAPPATTKAADKEAPAAVKQLSQREIDGVLEKAFGQGAQEPRRPIRLWIADLGLVLAAQEAGVDRDGRSVRFKSVSLALLNPHEIKPDVRILRGEEAILAADREVTKWSDLKTCHVGNAEVHEKNAIITLLGVSAPGGEAPVPPPAVTAAPAAPVDAAIVAKEPKAAPGVSVRFQFVMDPKKTVTELLPAAPKTPPRVPWTNEDLTRVPELSLSEPLSRELEKIEAMKKTAHLMARINHFNQKKTDGFMEALLRERPDLRGLPVLMGEKCRTRDEQARVFALLADGINRGLQKLKANGGVADAEWMEVIATLQGVNTGDAKQVKDLLGQGNLEYINRALVAAAMQILMPEAEPVRLRLARFLATVPHVDATKALARLAIFSPEESVRSAAVEGLKLRREKDYTDILLEGFAYPLPAVSRRAAEALVKLDRKDVLDQLVKVLEAPDPRLPVTRKVGGKEEAVVRELVRVNHNHNCALCHAPGNTSNVPEGVLTAAVPLPSEPLPKPSDGGYQSVPPPTPDIIVRIDTTYLRQDFSLMMPVADAHPWPDMQRFDFLVRTRVLTPSEAEASTPCCEAATPGELSPYHRSALYALRELTGRDTEPSAQAWRKLLKLPL